MNSNGLKCPVCGSEMTKFEDGVDKNGFEFERYRCANCGGTTTKYRAKTIRAEDFEHGII